MRKNIKKFKYGDNGQALVLVVLLLAVILAIGFAISNIFMVEIRLSGDVAKSVRAIMAADSGIEWMLYKRRKTETADQEPSNFNNNSCFLNRDCYLAADLFFTASKDESVSGARLISIGTYRDVKRGLRATW